MSSTAPAASVLYPSVARLKAQIKHDIKPWMKTATTAQCVYSEYVYIPSSAEYRTPDFSNLKAVFGKVVCVRKSDRTIPVPMEEANKLLEISIADIQSFMSSPEDYHKGCVDLQSFPRSSEL